jgi:hypothetical protein
VSSLWSDASLSAFVPVPNALGTALPATSNADMQIAENQARLVTRFTWNLFAAWARGPWGVDRESYY